VTPHSARSAPSGAIEAGTVVIAEWETMAERLEPLLRDSRSRRVLEERAASSLQTWEQSVAPLAEAIRQARRL
jgi:hypothetical protein